MEVHLREKVLENAKSDEFLDGDFTANLLAAGAPGDQDQEAMLSLVEIRNNFIHEGLIAEVSDQEIERFIHFTRSTLTA